MSRNPSDEIPSDPNVGEPSSDTPQEEGGAAEVFAFEEPPTPGSPGTEPPVIIND